MQFSKKIFLLFIFGIHLIYFIGSIILKTYINGDSYEYINQAENIFKHGSMYAAQWGQWPHHPEYYSIRPPLYAVLLLVTMYVSNSAYVLLFAQSLLSIFIVLRLRQYCLKYIPYIKESRLHWFLAMAMILNPIQFILCNYIFSDILLQFFITLGFFSLLDFLHEKQTKYFLFYILYMSLALLTKPVLVYFAYLNIGIALWAYIRVNRKLIIPISSLALPAIILLISLANEKNTGYFHFNSSKIFNIWTFNSTNFLNMKYGNDSGYIYKTYIYNKSLSEPTFKKQYEYVDSACTHVLMSNIKSYFPYHVQGAFNFFIAPGREFILGYLGIPDSQPKSFIKEINVNGWAGFKDYLKSQNVFLIVVNLLVTFWNILLIIGLCVFLLQKKPPLSFKIIAFIILAYFAGVSSLALGAARYKTGIYLILLFCNAWLLVAKKGSDSIENS